MSQREGRSLTLRKKKTHKRPVISAPQQASSDATTAPSTNTTLPTPRERRPGLADGTSDLVKRRYSTRYNQLPQFGNDDIPDMPALPGAGLKRRSHGGSPVRPSSAHSSHPLRIDQQALLDPNLSHEKYVTDLLSNASEKDIQEYQQNLERIKNRNNTDLQQTLYQNRTQFIKISKEAEKLKDEMSILRGLMADLTSTLEQSSLNTEMDSTENVSEDISLKRRNTNRSSVANLEAMWNTQLQQLWKSVEKSQKFLPAVPGRHVVLENGAWIELDSATWKPKRPIHLVLLNDHLLVASKKRKKIDPNVPQAGPAPTKNVAEECWPLGEIEVVDMAASMQNGAGKAVEEKVIASAFSIRCEGKIWTYRHDRRDITVKNDIVTSIRKAQEDLRKVNLPKVEKRMSRSELSNMLTRDTDTIKLGELTNGVDGTRTKSEVLVEVDGKQHNLRWLENQIDELDIDIALQRLDIAVEKLEKLQNISRTIEDNTPVQRLVNSKIAERASKLANTYCRELADTTSYVEVTKRITSHLVRLGFEDRAREVFLSTRSDALINRQRQCIFDGDLHKYVFSISYVYFTIIRNTVVIYQTSFPASTISACVAWANDHLETFNQILLRQLSAVDHGGRAWAECVDVVWKHERAMLGEVGLDFRQVIGRGLQDQRESENNPSTARSRSTSRSKSRTRVG